MLSLVPEARADKVTEAKLRFERGVELIRSGEVRKGLDELLISNRLAPNPNTLFNVARLLDHLKYVEYAYLAYDEYLRAGGIEPSDRLRAAEALVRLGKEVARVEIESDPPGAQIFMNRESLGDYGRTPRQVASKPGRHLIILKLPNHEPRRVEINLEKGSSTRLSIALPRTHGFVRFDLASRGERILRSEVSVKTLEGMFLGTADEIFRLPVGPTSLKLEAPQFESQLLEFNVLPPALMQNEDPPSDEERSEYFNDPPPQSVLVTLEARQASVRVLSNKTGALIYLDEREVGFTPQVVPAEVGEHKLRLELTGYNPWEGTFLVNEASEQWVGEIQFRRPPQDRFSPIWPWTLAGLSLGSAIVGGYFGYQGYLANRDQPPYPTEADVSQGNRYLLIADAASLVSLVSGVGSFLLFRSLFRTSTNTPRARFYERETPVEELPPFVELGMEPEVVDDSEEETSPLKSDGKPTESSGQPSAGEID